MDVLPRVQLAAHEAWTILVDRDFLVSYDVRKVLKHAGGDKSVSAVQHEYQPANHDGGGRKAADTLPAKELVALHYV